MVWKVRRVDEFDTTDVVSPTDFATAADAMDVSLDDAVVRLKAYLTTSPTEDIGADVRAYRRVIRNDLRIRFKIGDGTTVTWTVYEQP